MGKRRDANRKKVFRRDRGICATCRTDCVIDTAVLREWLRVTFHSRGERRKQLRRMLSEMKITEKEFRRAHMWTVDHVVPKSKGGSDDLGNLQTLCFRCHRKKTRGEQKGRKRR